VKIQELATLKVKIKATFEVTNPNLRGCCF